MPKNEIVVAVVDDDQERWVKMCRVVNAEGYQVANRLVTRDESILAIVDWIERRQPHIILLDEDLANAVTGPDVLGALKEPYWSICSPRIISVSKDPSNDFLRLCGGSFEGKEALTLPDEDPDWREKALPLIEQIEYAITRSGL